MKPQYSSRLRRIHPKVHNEIRRYRLQLGITQCELARRVGVRLSTLSSWELGMTCPALPMAIKMAKILNTLAEGLYLEMFTRRDEVNAPTASRGARTGSG